jgi:hypothetical protein
MKIIIQTRFSIFKFPPRSWHTIGNKYQNSEEYLKWLYSSKRLDEKMRIFNNFTKLSIESQTYNNYEWIFYISDSLPRKYKDQLSKIKKSKIIIIDKYKNIRDAFLLKNNENFISIRLDDDDGLHPTYFEKIKNFAFPNQIIAPMYGNYFNLSNDNINLKIQKIDNIKYIRACGIGAYKKNIHSYGRHSTIHERHKVTFIKDENMFFVSVGEHTTSNRNFLNKKNIIDSNINDLFK